MIHTVPAGSKIKDTQCGFKLFSRKAAALLFPVQVRISCKGTSQLLDVNRADLL